MTQTNQAFGVGLPSVEKIDKDPGFGTPSSIIATIQENFPEYRFYGAEHLTNRILKDNEFGRKVATSFYQAALEADTEFRKQVEKDPNVGFNTINRILQNMRKESLSLSYTGQDVRRTVLDRASQIGRDGTPRPNSDIPVGTVRNQNPLPSTQDYELGMISSIKESGNNPAAISSRKEYGKWQISVAAGTMDKFLSSSYMDDFREHFAGVKPGSKEFDEKFKTIASDEKFIDAQRRYVTDTHFSDVEKMWLKAGIDTKNVAVREAIFSASVQHSGKGNERILKNALANVSDIKDTQSVLKQFYSARKNYVAGLTMEGVNEKEKQNILGRYDTEFAEVAKLIGKTDVPIPDPDTIRTAISRNPQKYPELVPDPKNPNIPSGAVGDKQLVTQAQKDPQFREKITEDSISLFENELLQVHNMPINPSTETDMYSASYAIFHGYGPEGLTQFINLLQLSQENEGRSEAAKDERLRKAEFWFKRKGPNGYSPQQYAATFVSGLVVQPQKPTIEAEYELPKDWNNFTTEAYKLDDTTKSTILRKPEEFGRRLVDYYYGSPSTNVIENSRLFPKMRDNAEVKNSLLQQIGQGYGTYYSDLVQDIAFGLVRGDGPYTVQDFINTVGANAEYDSATGQYIIQDVTKLSPHVRMAIDILKQNPDTEKLFIRAGTTDFSGPSSKDKVNSLIFAPDRYSDVLEGKGTDNLAKTLISFIRPLYRTKKQDVYDGKGNIVGSYTEPDNEGINYLINGLLDIPLGAASVFTGVLEGIAIGAAGVTGALGMESTSQNFKHIADLYDDVDIYYNSDPSGDNVLGSVLGTATEMATLYFGAARLGAWLPEIAKSMNVLSRYNKAYKIGTSVAPQLAGSSNKWNVARDLFSKRAAKIYVGFGAMDTFTGDQNSLLNTPLLGEDVQRFYRRQDEGTKAALNVLSGIAAGEIFDWGLAGMRTLWTKGVRNKATMGWGEEILSRTQVGEMISGVSAGLRDMDIGDYATARAKYLSEGAVHLSERNPENLADIAVGFTAGMGSSFRTLREDLVDKIKTENTRRSMALNLRMTEEQIQNKADNLYNETIRGAARGVLNMVQAGRGGVEDATWLRFTQLLEEGSGMATIRPVTNEHGVISEFDNVADAVQQTYKKAEDGSLTPNGRFYRVNDEGKYNLYEVENDLWAYDLASEIRRIASQKIDQTDAIKAITISRHGANFTPEQLARVSEDTSLFIGRVGKTVDGENVRILSKEEDGYFVQMADGTYAKKKLVKDVVPEETSLADDMLTESLDEVKLRAETAPGATLSETRSLFKPNIGEARKMSKLAEATQNVINAIRATGRQVSKTGKDFSDGFVNSIGKFTGLAPEAVRESMPTIARVIGLENLDNITVASGKKRLLAPGMGKGTDIREFSITNRKKTTQKGVAVKVIDNDLSESFYVSNKKTQLNPTAWVMNKNGKLIANPDWDRLDLNPTLHRYQKTGEFQTWVREDNGWYRPAMKHEQGVLLNIRKPFRVNNTDIDARLSDEDLFTHNIDGYYALVDGVPYYRPVLPFQAIEPTALAKKTVYKPTYVEYPEPKLRDAQGNIVENVPSGRVIDTLADEEIGRIVAKDAAGETLTDVEAKVMRELSEDVERTTDDVLSLEGTQRELFDTEPTAQRTVAEETGPPPVRTEQGSEMTAAEREMQWRRTGRREFKPESNPDIKISGLGGRLGGGITGAMIGTLFTDEENDSFGGGLGLVVGGILGGRGRPGRAFNRTVDYVSNITKKPDPNVPPPYAQNLDVRNKAAEQARAQGMMSEATEENIAWFNKTKDANRKSVAKGESIFKNRHIQSAFSFLTELSPRARQFRDILMELPHQGAKYRSIATNQYNFKYGSEAYENIKTTGAVELRRLFDADPVLSREFAGMSEPEAMRQFNKFQTLALETNGFSIKGIEASVSAKDWFARNPDLRRIYETLMEDPRFMDHMRFTKDMLDTVRKDYTQNVKADISRSFNRLSENDKVVLSPWLFSDTVISSADYRKILRRENGSKVMMFDRIVRDTPLGSKIASMNDKLVSFEKYNDGYFTQMLDAQSFALLRKSVADDFLRKNPQATGEEVEKAVLDWQVSEFIRLNDKASSTTAKTYLYHFNEEMNDLVEKTYTTKDQALSELQTILNNRRMSGDVSDRIAKDMDQLVTQDPSGLWRVNMGDPNYADVFADYKKAQVERYIVSYMTGSAIKTSNYLDRSRKFHIPLEWRVTDVNTWLYRYTQDVGQRNHLLKHGIVDHHDLQRDWLKEIEREVLAKTNDIAKTRTQVARVHDIYNQQTGLVKAAMEGQTAQERLALFDQRAKLDKNIGIFKNLAFAPFAATISFLDVFSPAILGSLLSSFKSIGSAYKVVGNTENLNALIEFASGAGAVSKKLSLINPAMEDVDHILADNTIVNGMYDLSRKAADYGSRFSIGRSVEWGLNRAGINASIDNNGVAKLIFGNFYDVNAVSTTVNYVGALYEIQGLLKRYADEGLTSEIESRFANFGISKNRISAFAKNSESFDELTQKLRTGQSIRGELANVHSSLYNDLTDVLTYVTDSYHGRNLMNRPESWNTSVGKLLSQFSMYPYNFAAQVYKRRIQYPIQNWMDKYNSQISEEATVPKIMFAMATNNKKQLKEWKFTDEAINDLPIDALHTVYKALGSFGLSVATFATRDAYLDAVNYPMLELMGAEEKEQFKRTKRNFTLNPYAPESERITWGEIDDINDVGTAMKWSMSWFSRAGFLGKAGDVLGPFTARDGIVGMMGPGASMINDMVKSVGRVYNGDFEDMPKNATKEITNTILKRVPAIGGYGVNRIVGEALFDQKKKTGFNDNDGIILYDQWKKSVLEGQNLLDR